MDLERAVNLSRQIRQMEPHNTEGFATKERFDSVGARIEALEPISDHLMNRTHVTRFESHRLFLRLTNHYKIYTDGTNRPRELRGITAKWSRDIDAPLSGDNEIVISIEHAFLTSFNHADSYRALGLIEESVDAAEQELGLKPKE